MPYFVCKSLSVSLKIILNLHAFAAFDKLSAAFFTRHSPFSMTTRPRDRTVSTLPLIFSAFVGAVIDVHMLRVDAEGVFFFGVEDHDVGIRTDGDRAFFREHSEHFRGGGRGQFDKTI